MIVDIKVIVLNTSRKRLENTVIDIICIEVRVRMLINNILVLVLEYYYEFNYYSKRDNKLNSNAIVHNFSWDSWRID